MACEDCLEVCFMGLVIGRNYVWCLVIVVIFMRFGQAGAKSCGGCLKVINCGWRKSQKRGTLFIGKAGFSLCLLLFCETLLQVLLGIYTVTDFIRYLFSLYYCCFTCLSLPRTKVQLKVSLLY